MHRWKFSVLAAAAVALTGLYADDASALALGRITVQSALGEPLRAEIDLPQITPSEAETLRATTASPDVFRAQGMEFNPAVNNLRVQLQRRADGTAVLRLSSDRPINDPFVDLVLDASWGSGHIVRSYTMLFDPPTLRRAAPAVTAAPQITAPAAPVQAPATAPTPRPAAAPAVASAPRSATPTQPRPTPADGVTVQAGDTAGRIANTYRPATVSLDQMLVALMRANPDAFIQGNVNRMKAGAVLQIPDEAAAQATPASEARQILSAQSRDFNAFRRKLAAAAPTTEVAAAERSASGTVQARVEDKKPATTAPDKLTLSKGSIKGHKAAEDQLAKDKQASESSARLAELSKNINELNKLTAASAPTVAPAAGASTPSGVAVTAPATAAATQPPAVVPQPVASEPVASAAAAAASASAEPAPAASDSTVPAEAAAASAPAPAPAPKRAPAPAPAPLPEPSFIDGLMEDPLLPAGGLLALLALAGYGAYRVVQRRRNSAGVDSSFLESRLQPDSFFGASGGQHVDTANSEMTTGSSMAYSPSQLDAGGDVDPVAEADVYLAYGRDLQAEEILKEAIRHNPARVSVHVKLAEIYAKRQDRKALEAVASEVFKLTQGEGSDWARVAELGRELDAENALYQPGGRPGLPATVASAAAVTAMASPLAAPAAAVPPDLDLDLDLDLPSDALSEAPAAPGGFAAAAAAATESYNASAAEAPTPPVLPSLDLLAPSLPAEAPSVAPAPVAPPPMADLDFPAADELTMLPSAAMPLTSDAAKDAPDSGSMDFDLGDLTLDLGTSSKPAAATTAAAPAVASEAADDPLATKLALAEEFNAIGDTDGARTLIEEVVAESSGALKARAQRLLADLG